MPLVGMDLEDLSPTRHSCEQSTSLMTPRIYYLPYRARKNKSKPVELRVPGRATYRTTASNETTAETGIC
jgi:hypothetical protein